MIPKVIHYCWFGNRDKPKLIKKCIQSWKKMGGYEVIEWNENNCDFHENNYLKKAYENKKWAFISDYIRLKVLYEYGGIYFDTDIEVKKSFDDIFLKNKLLICFMFNCNLSTAIIGCEAKNKDILNILNLYRNKSLEIKPNNDLFTEYFLENYPQFKLNNRYQCINNEITIYPKEYFECPSIKKHLGYSIHHFEGSWRGERKKIKLYIKKICGVYLYQNIIRYRAIKKSPFYNIYIQHK